jgi:hypothetical protein
VATGYLLKLLVAVATVFYGAGAEAATLAATPDTVARVTNEAAPGDTVVLAAGSYGPMAVKARTDLTIDARAATVTGGWRFKSTPGLVVRGGKWSNGCKATPCYDYALSVHGSERVTLEGLSVAGPGEAVPGEVAVMADGYGLGLTRVRNAVVRNVALAGFKMALGLSFVDGFTVSGVSCDAMRSDCINLAQSWNGVVEDVACGGTRVSATEHPDCVQGWSRADAPPTGNITIRRVIAVGGTQGLGFFNHRRTYKAGTRLADGTVLATDEVLDDGGFGTLTIEDCQVFNSYPQAIAAYGVRDLRLRRNVVRTLPGARFRSSINTAGSIVTQRCGNVVAAGAGKPAASDRNAC